MKVARDIVNFAWIIAASVLVSLLVGLATHDHADRRAQGGLLTALLVIGVYGELRMYQDRRSARKGVA